MLRPACLVVVVVISLFAASAYSADPPRYKLPVGRVLYYSGEGASKGKSGDVSISKSTWRFTVLADNPDGSAQILVRLTSAYGQQGRQADETVSFAIFDLYPDGRYRIDPELATSCSPEVIFPRLPTDAEQPAKLWQSDVNWTGNHTTFTPRPDDSSAEFVFTGLQDGPINRIYVTTLNSTYHFDTAKGVIRRLDGEHSQDYGFHSKGTFTLKLDKEENLPADQVQALARDYASYTDALKQYRDQMKALHEQPDKAKEIIDAARQTLATTSENVRRPDVKQQLKTKLENHDRYASNSVDDAKRLAGVLNKPAPDWSAKDLDGQEVSAKSLRGKVVVMDFWYRGCGWCMYAMPQVKQLASDFKDKPVAILGMNTDRDLADAKFVVKELALNYPQLQATGLPEKFAVQGFPTLIIIDHQGSLRDLHVGYSPNLRETVSKKIEALLK
jgi:thiol-disulfide isomerase/thioredoxin